MYCVKCRPPRGLVSEIRRGQIRDVSMFIRWSAFAVGNYMQNRFYYFLSLLPGPNKVLAGPLTFCEQSVYWALENVECMEVKPDCVAYILRGIKHVTLLEVIIMKQCNVFNASQYRFSCFTAKWNRSSVYECSLITGIIVASCLLPAQMFF